MHLIITNGGSAVHTIQNAGIEGEVISWDDALHDGPVPGGKTLEELSEIRAKYISDLGWGTYEEIHQRFIERDSKLKQHGDYDELILWFEHDLYDQLQLMQILAWLYENWDQSTKLTIICERKYVSEQEKTDIQQQWNERLSLNLKELNIAKSAWAAFTSNNPQNIVHFTRQENDIFYFIEALQRFLQEYPSVINGLRKTEQETFELLQLDSSSLGQAFRHLNIQTNYPKYLGDTSFALYISGLSNVDYPLVTFSEHERITYHPLETNMHLFWEYWLRITDIGNEVYQGKQDHIKLNGIDRWMGGVHLTPANIYRYDVTSEDIIIP